MSKGQEKQSRVSHNPRLTLSKANFKTVVHGFFSLSSFDINAASSGKLIFTSATISFSFNSLTRFDETAKEFTSIAQSHKKYAQI